MDRAEALRQEILKTEDHLKALKAELAAADTQSSKRDTSSDSRWKWPLSAPEYERYGRQLIVPAVGVSGQLAPPFQNETTIFVKISKGH